MARSPGIALRCAATAPQRVVTTTCPSSQEACHIAERKIGASKHANSQTDAVSLVTRWVPMPRSGEAGSSAGVILASPDLSCSVVCWVLG